VQDAGGLVSVAHAQPLARLAQVVDHRVVGQPELAADLLAVEVLVDEAKDLALTIRESIHTRVRRLIPPVHLHS
jgi:hypothetical protein